MVLAVNEAVANAAEHAYTPTESSADAVIEFNAHLVMTGQLRQAMVTVRDHGQWRPRVVNQGYRGRGLELMRALTENMQIDATSTGTHISMISQPVPLIHTVAKVEHVVNDPDNPTAH